MKKILSIFTTLLTCFLMLPLGMIKVGAGQMLGQQNFDSGVGLPWHTCETAPAVCEFNISGGTYNVTVVNPGGSGRGGEDRWDLQFRHRGLKIVSGRQYRVKYSITATNSGMYYTKIGNLEGTVEVWHNMSTGAGDFESNWDCIRINANETKNVDLTFTASQSVDVAEWAFHLGGSGQYTPNDCFPEGTVISFDNMSLECLSSDDTDYVPEEEYVRSEILVNQIGYYPEVQKRATLISSAASPVDFKLLDSSGKEVYSGKTAVFGFDKDSGDTVHTLDFTDYTSAGSGYTLTADGKTSYAFDISEDIYQTMLYDSLKYFYHNRSGAVEMPYCEKAEYARAAGPADTAVPTETGQSFSSWAYNESYTLDVSGGWYDAGDHGKYVVNGGLSVWIMQNQYERTLYIDGATPSLYGDGSMNIPESGNGFPDILDEARYELEFMLKMMVPDGKPMAGMVHHKIHDVSWTGLAIAPADDTKDRIIKPPTTAATLNLAATAAQAYRVWKDLDADFADTCLAAAEKAYAAAKKHPSVFAPLDESVGGGAYGDDYVEDDFYWAASELYLSTDNSAYDDDMKSRKFYLKCVTALEGGEETDSPSSFNWANTASLGTLSVALAGGGDMQSEAQSSIVSAADYYAELEEEQGYGLPFKQCTAAEGLTGYPWGSNSFVMNNALVMAYAYDYTADSKYINAVTQAMDYLMGRNPMDNCYVTGYGDNSTKYPHHRFFANQVDDNFPTVPAGFISGGPNSALQDPWVKGMGWSAGERAPQLCYMDHIESWSTNEVTVNWNAPLAWLTGYLTDTLSDAEGISGGITGNPSDSKSNTKDTQSGSKNNLSPSQDDEDGINKILIIVCIAAGIILAVMITAIILLAKSISNQTKSMQMYLMQQQNSNSNPQPPAPVNPENNPPENKV